MEKKIEQPKNNNNGTQRNYYRDSHKEQHRDTQKAPYRESQGESQQRESQQRESQPRESQQRDYRRDNSSNNQKNFHKEGQPPKEHNREGFRENREQHRPYGGRPVFRQKVDETVDDIKEDILRIEKEVDLEIKEIKSMRLGI